MAQAGRPGTSCETFRRSPRDAHGMTVVSMKRVDGLLDAVRQNLPRPVSSSGEFEDWNVVGPALIAIAADLFEVVMGATPPRGRVRAEVLARTLTEYAITFAWLSA